MKTSNTAQLANSTPTANQTPTQVLEEAKRLSASGLSVIPVKANGSKAPVVGWSPYQKRIATPEELEGWFSQNAHGLGIVAGAVSGGLVVIDIDDASLVEPWQERIRENNSKLLERLAMVKTPNGAHFYYRCKDKVGGGQKLAQKVGKNDKPKTTIEIRSEGNYVVAPGSPAACHPSGQLYELQIGELTELSLLSGKEHEALLEYSYAFNEFLEPKRVVGHPAESGQNRPGDDFNTRASWENILEPHDWNKVRERDEVTEWRRPGKEKGISATTNIGDSNLLYVFSTNGDPFKAQAGYKPFTAYTLLNHAGDFSAAAADLASKGYGQPVHSNLYGATRSGLQYFKPTKRGPVPVPLTNFTARISTDVIEDDGIETRHSFELEATLNGQTSRFTIPASRFRGLQWVVEELGAQAVVHPYGGAQRTPVAIQLLSGNIFQKRVFTHIGWRKCGDKWVYLHAGGALGHDGAVNGIEVQLNRELSRFRLIEPEEDLVESIQASLRLLDLAPDKITIPLFCSIWRAIVGRVDCSLHLTGPTGEAKSELAALCQQHFGSEMVRLDLPASWSSSENALEDLAFLAKDAILVIDDFAPTGTSFDIPRFHKKADRVIRAQGNSSARQRMRPDSSLRPTRPPRGLILSTGEDIPRGQSLKARLWVIEVSPGDVSFESLTLCQEDAANGCYSKTTAGFIRWLAPQYEVVRQNLQKKICELRKQASKCGMHKRTPDIVANFGIGLRLFLDFAEHTGAITAESKQELWNRGWEALGEGAVTQQGHQTADEPTRQFLELLTAAVASGKAHVAGPDGEAPGKLNESEAWGWRFFPTSDGGDYRPQGSRMGWIDGADLYLEPKAAYAAAQQMATASGGSLVVTESTLRKRLQERNLLRSTEEGRLTVRKVLGGVRRSVLHLHRNALAQFVAQSVARK